MVYPGCYTAPRSAFCLHGVTFAAIYRFAAIFPKKMRRFDLKFCQSGALEFELSFKRRCLFIHKSLHYRRYPYEPFFVFAPPLKELETVICGYL